MQEIGFWNDTAKAKKIATALAQLREEVGAWDRLFSDIQNLEEVCADGDQEFSQEIEKEFENVQKRFSELEFEALFAGQYDANNAIVALHAGTGGVDAMDWTEMLARMYARFCEKMKWKVKILDEQRGGEAGIKTITFEVIGRHAYGHLKAEHGVHRLVRISPFDAEGMRHTSFALVEVIPDMGSAKEIEVRPEDVRIDVFRASGHGGQSVNTTDSAVRITHLPTGIVVSCQNERSQLQNKETALRYLKSKLQKLAESNTEEEKKALRGSYSEAAWGNQIRSYVLNPYRLVKDHRTHHETQDVQGVLDGEILPFIETFLRTRV